ncbi:spore coat protein YutH [Salipaludibacillus neizhouensis]|uniref:Spore coat protein YutH n=1 Tax=Salipaludibacillus neizhouensis TaxID=885475 RepID=A0A3A9KDF2_9BACI|nr:spore coat protein YutH [Salipaludibacillus neizhouensis]RKL65465.1 spore coat protein YutH [Salipaludibacillus neizhouensis]
MLERHLYEHFGIHLKNVEQAGNDLIIFDEQETYILRPYPQTQIVHLEERLKMAEHFQSLNHLGIAYPMKAKGGSTLNIIDGQETVLFQLKTGLNREQQIQEKSKAKKLAQFHLDGESYVSTSKQENATWTSWRERWIKRLEQLESWYVKIMNEPVKTALDTEFILTFPYYLAMTENAIQMVTEMISMKPSYYSDGNGRTVCHHRFHENSWLKTDNLNISDVKFPTDFVCDHFTRDITEYLRHIAKNEQVLQEKIDRANRFIKRYHSVKNFVEWDGYIIVSRLLFPAQYFDVLEKYYQAIDDKTRSEMETKFVNMVTKSEDYEMFIQHICSLFFTAKDPSILPEWLIN